MLYYFPHPHPTYPCVPLTSILPCFSFLPIYVLPLPICSHFLSSPCPPICYPFQSCTPPLTPFPFPFPISPIPTPPPHTPHHVSFPLSPNTHHHALLPHAPHHHIPIITIPTPAPIFSFPISPSPPLFSLLPLFPPPPLPPPLPYLSL